MHSDRPSNHRYKQYVQCTLTAPGYAQPWDQNKTFSSVSCFMSNKKGRTFRILWSKVWTWTHTNIKDYNKHVPNCCCWYLFKDSREWEKEKEKEMCKRWAKKGHTCITAQTIITNTRTKQKNYHKWFHIRYNGQKKKNQTTTRNVYRYYLTDVYICMVYKFRKLYFSTDWHQNEARKCFAPRNVNKNK